MNAKEVLNHYWTYSNFYGTQEKIIQNVLDGQNTLAILPTGGGKSLCYQIPALLLDGLTLVISPLIALMKDQVAQLKDKGIKATLLSSELTDHEILAELDNCKFGGYKMLYISPERLRNPLFLTRILDLNIALIAVDEAHCVSQWGHDFRPEYLKIKNFCELVPNANLIAVTATATPKVIADIKANLGLKNETIFKESLKRENLSYHIHHSQNKLSDLKILLKKHKGSSIVFVRTRKSTFETANFLNSEGIDAEFYHAKLSTQEKNKKQSHWAKSQDQVMVATNAFGMGIDKNNVRTVFHLDIPQSIEAYVQEVGRAGRDKIEARGILLLANEDPQEVEKIFKSQLPSQNNFFEIINYLFSYLQVAEGELPSEPFNFDQSNFVTQFNFNKNKVKKILDFLHQQEIIYLQNYQKNSRIEFLIHPNQLDLNKESERILEYLSRKYTGIFMEASDINEYDIARDLKISVSDIKKKLHQWHREEWLRYEDKNVQKLQWLVPRETSQIKAVWWKKFEQLQIKHWQKLEAILYFVREEKYCREKLILKYFGENPKNDCGKCDICTEISGKEDPNLQYQLMVYLENAEKSFEEILIYFNHFQKEDIMFNLQFLLDEGILSQKGLNQFIKV